MKRIFLILLLLLTFCSSPQPAIQVIEATSIPTLEPSLTPTFTLSSAAVTLPPTHLPTDTPMACDPYLADYCITDGHFLLQRPIRPPANNSVDGTYRYASTANGTRDPHHGVEIGKDYGAPVQAAADGVVVFAGADEEARYSPWINFYGNMIVIQHANGLFTLYAHLSIVAVQPQQAVRTGEKIGEVGQSGAATGSHLHFEVRRGEVENYFSTVNPELWLIPSQPEYGVVSLKITDAAGLFQSTKLTLQHYSDANAVLETYYAETYDLRMPASEENAALGELPGGRYRITLIQKGRLYERWVEVQSGKLTQVVIVIE